MITGLTLTTCSCSWWRRLLGWHSAHVPQRIMPSRYAPGSKVEGVLDYAELETAYEDALWGEEEPNFAISTIDSMARWRSSNTGETPEVAHQWLIDHSDLVDIEGVGRVYQLRSDVGTMWMYP